MLCGMVNKQWHGEQTCCVAWQRRVPFPAFRRAPTLWVACFLCRISFSDGKKCCWCLHRSHEYDYLSDEHHNDPSVTDGSYQPSARLFI